MVSGNVDPLAAVERQSAFGHDDMAVDVQVHALSPGVQRQHDTWHTTELTPTSVHDDFDGHSAHQFV